MPAGIGNFVVAFLTALTSVAVYFALTRRIGFNVADEGYLWYGALRTAEGQIPIRDFRAYDPARYYWCAVWIKGRGPGIVSLRAAAASFQVVGLTCALLVVQRAVQSWWLVALAGVVLTVWSYPRHKAFDTGLTMIVVYVAVRLIEAPVSTGYLLAGASVGLVTFFGLNHGLYALGAFVSLTAVISVKLGQGDAIGNFLWLSIGIIAGATPFLSMLLAVSGMARAYVRRKVLPILRRRATNLPMPVPWPWRDSSEQLAGLGRPGRILFGSFFVLLPLFWLAAIARVIGTPGPLALDNSVLVAAAFVGIFYLHHAFSRPDVSHLSQDMAPFILAFFALPWGHPPAWWRPGLLALAVAVACATLVLVRLQIPAGRRASGSLVAFDVGGDELLLPAPLAAVLKGVGDAVERQVASSEAVFLAPDLIGLYPVLGRTAPVYDTFCVHPATAEMQEEMLAELRRRPVTLAVIHDLARDGREDLRFNSTHPRVWQYLRREFDSLERAGVADGYRLFVRRC